MSTQFGDWKIVEKTISWYLRGGGKINKIKHKNNSDKKAVSYKAYWELFTSKLETDFSN